MSTNPGVTSLPRASISSAPLPKTLPTSMMRPPPTAMTPSPSSPPSPSAMLPPRITRSGFCAITFRPKGFGGRIMRRVCPKSTGCARGSGMQNPAVGLLGGLFRALIGGQRQQHGERHEHRRDAEHKMRQVVVHDPAEQQRADDAAEVEP